MKVRIVLISVLCLAAIAAAPFAGGEPEGFVFWQLRVPRLLMAVLVGGTLSLVGACFQTIFGNPLAAPSTVGTTAGATLGALAALVLGTTSMVAGFPLVALAAFVGAMLVGLTISAVAASGRARVNDVLLVGIALSLAASALATGLQYTADMAAMFTAVQWSLGHLSQVGYDGVLMVLPFVAVTVIVLLAQTRALAALIGGEERAHSQGVDVRRVRTLTLGIGSLGVAACVAWCGPIAFVGLIVPHLVRRGVGSSLRVLLPMSLLVGAAFLALCDTAARLMIPGRELPVGVLTAAIGAPALIWLVAKRR